MENFRVRRASSTPFPVQRGIVFLVQIAVVGFLLSWPRIVGSVFVGMGASGSGKQPIELPWTICTAQWAVPVVMIGGSLLMWILLAARRRGGALIVATALLAVIVAIDVWAGANWLWAKLLFSPFVGLYAMAFEGVPGSAVIDLMSRQMDIVVLFYFDLGMQLECGKP
jgi:hypothetical protein